MVLAPEHELVSLITTDNCRAEVESYIHWAGSRSDIERMAEGKKVTGVPTGAFAINPFNGEKVPVYIADYVLAGYGTGAVMAVPSGDQRDWNFAKHFNLPIIPILDAQGDTDVAANSTKEGGVYQFGFYQWYDLRNGSTCTHQLARKPQDRSGKNPVPIAECDF